MTHLLLTKEKRTVRVVSLLLNLIKMPLKHKENVLTTIEDIQRLASKDLKNILRENAVPQGGNKADLVMKVYAIIMQRETEALSLPNSESSSDFTYATALRNFSINLVRRSAIFTRAEFHSALRLPLRKYSKIQTHFSEGNKL